MRDVLVSRKVVGQITYRNEKDQCKSDPERTVEIGSLVVFVALGTNDLASKLVRKIEHEKGRFESFGNVGGINVKVRLVSIHIQA